MKNVIIAAALLLLLVCLTVASAVNVNRFASTAEALLLEGRYSEAAELFQRNRRILALTVGGDELERLEDALIRLVHDDESAAMTAVSVCREISSRERLFRKK